MFARYSTAQDQATRAARFTTEYAERALSTDALAALKPGKNTFAVHCRNTTGGQYVVDGGRTAI